VPILPAALREKFASSIGPAEVPRTDIAVVIPLYNHERFIAATLRSLLDQTAAPAEIVLIDDGSTDDGLAVARALLADLTNCRVLAQANMGTHATINRAVALTSAPYVAVLNSDDLFAPDKLAWCQKLIEANPSVTLIAGRVGLIGERGERLTRGPAAEWLARAHAIAARGSRLQLSLLQENFIATTSNLVFSRAFWRRAGGFAALRYCHDLDFVIRAFDDGQVLLDRNRTHVRYRVHPGNTITKDPRGAAIELAAVIAASLCQPWVRSPTHGGAEFERFMESLRARHLSDLVLDLMESRPRYQSRDEFLRFALGEAARDSLVAPSGA